MLYKLNTDSNQKRSLVEKKCRNVQSRWWFQICFIFIPTWEDS